MKLDITQSLIYDTINFFNIYFDYDKTEQSVIENGLDVEKNFMFYYSIKHNFEINNSICALFISTANHPTFLTKFFLKYIGHIGKLSELKKLLLNKNILLQELTSYYFPGEKSITDDMLFKLENTDSRVILSLNLIISKHKETILSFIKHIDNIHILIKQLYENNMNIIKSFKPDANYVFALNETYKTNISEKNVYLISLLSPFSIKCGYDESTKSYVCALGYLSKKTLKNGNSLFHVNFYSMTSLLSNKIIIDILDIIFEHKKINSSKIINLIPYELSDSSIYRLLSELLTEKAIKVVERKSKVIYYSINDEYLKKASFVFNSKINYYIKNSKNNIRKETDT